MKRSEINEIIAEAAAFIRAKGCILPPFADWTPEEMGQEAAAPLRERGLGWDVTDYNQGRFTELGLTLFTARNGDAADLSAGRGMLYAEKIMISRKDQLSPMHRHIVKAEDIINRGGGALVVELFMPAADLSIDREAEVVVPVDGRIKRMAAGARLSLAPGESVTLMPGVWHAFWAEGEDVLIGEVSTVNDDLTDNVFDPPLPRFSALEEDAAPTRLLVADYQEAGRG